MTPPSKTSFLTALKMAWVWRSKKRRAGVFYGFAKAEQASMLDMESAAVRTSSPERAAFYLQHSRDETLHARMFLARAQKLKAELHHAPFASLVVDTEDLFQSLGEKRFLAFVHLGETRALKDFTTYIQYFSRKGLDKERAMLERIVVDEERHANYTYDLLVQLCGSPKKAKTALRNISFWELRRMWMRKGRWLSEQVYQSLSLLLYVVMAPLSLWIRWVRPTQSSWRIPAKGL